MRCRVALALGVLSACAGDPGRAPPKPLDAYLAAHPPSPVPSARELFRLHLEAIGGEAIVRSHTSVVIEGNAVLGLGKKGRFKLEARAPNIERWTLDFGAEGRFERGFDGVHAWSDDPFLGPRLLGGAELAETRLSSELYRDVEFDALYPELGEVESFSSFGPRAFRLDARSRAGIIHTLQFSEIDHLLSSRSRVAPLPGCTSAIHTTTYSEYRDFEGHNVPTEISDKLAGESVLLNVETVRWNAAPDLDGAPPARVLAMYAE